MVEEAYATVAGEQVGSKLAYYRWTGPWLVENIQQHGRNFRVMMAGGIIRKRVVSTASLKISYRGPLVSVIEWRTSSLSWHGKQNWG